RRLYDGDDVPDDDISNDFRIGPIVSREFWAGKGSLGLDRGPWTSPIDYFTAIIRNEIQYLKTASPHDNSDPMFRDGSQNDPNIHINTLLALEKLLPKLVSTIPPPILSKALHHPDLSPANIVINNAEAVPKIAAVLDWQSTTIAPLFLQAKVPRHFDWQGSASGLVSLPDGLTRPQKPENFASSTKNCRRWSCEKCGRHVCTRYISHSCLPIHSCARGCLMRMLAFSKVPLTLLPVLGTSIPSSICVGA
ncbi:hypothetical protein BT69DRAFT_1370257, partial [Atractiella rhizophila]